MKQKKMKKDRKLDKAENLIIESVVDMMNALFDKVDLPHGYVEYFVLMTIGTGMMKCHRKTFMKSYFKQILESKPIYCEKHKPKKS